ncbi:MAG: tryptophan 7-halogenase [Xanthomonadales bacterium]|nr:tryptophan 7-halogenase [Xanthomonadales bacterium]
MSQQRIKDVIIVGGGTAGWMTAAALSHNLDPDRYAITLIESEMIGTVGVGEATIPAIHEFNRQLGIDEKDFMRKTQASFKLGIEFVNWGRIGDSYIHPFAPFGQPMNNAGFHHVWLKMRQQGESASFEDYSLPIVAARSGRFDYPNNDPRSPRSTYQYAFHFDAGLYARYLREWSEARGVTRVEGKVVDVSQDAESGFVTGVTLESGQSVEGQLFVDCSGFRGLLIEQTLKAGFDDWSHWLPCNSAAPLPSENSGPPAPHTRATALTAGWQWRIPLQHRTGNGHVYCSEFISDDEAAQMVIDNTEGKLLAEPRLLRFTTGRRKRAWIKNCVAVGLSGGFLEPLESTAIYLIQSAITKLIRNFPGNYINEVEVEEFNRQINNKFDQVRNLLILHYKLTEREDTPFWSYCRNMSIPDELAHRMALFGHRGHVAHKPSELFNEPSWLAVLIGQGLIPESYDRRIDSLPEAETRNRLAQIRQLIAQTAQSMPRHEETIARHCAAEAPA